MIFTGRLPRAVQYLLVVIIYTFAYAYCLVFAPSLVGETGWKGDLNTIHESCVCENVSPLDKLSIRGEKYFIGSPEASERAKKCMITFWGFTHASLYTLLGFLFPDLFFETFAIGVGFELYEKEKYDCHDTFDILLNSGGFLFGAVVSSFIFGP